ncbi:MAG: glycosyltransferase family 4 protein, partial [Patescibacteria group bacterium]|nr:glycosyltransferase family 4 protein [Patescibacteria group bacterium]
LDKKVFLKGSVNNVNEYLQSADIFIMPSLWEGFSIALLEAMASEKIIITTPVGGNTEAVEDNKTGFIVKPKDSKALAEKIDYVLSLPEEEKKRITENARKSVEERFSVEKMVGEYEKLYEELTR